MGKLMQIREEDLAELVRLVPLFAARLPMSPGYTNRDKVHIRRVQKILSDVRWDYQPHGNVTIVSADEDFDDDQSDMPDPIG